MKSLLLLSLFLSVRPDALAPCRSHPVRPDVRNVSLGGLNLQISDSWTAQVFHIVDQLSQWSTYSHRQYVRWAKKAFQMNHEDSVFLSDHAKLRNAHDPSDDFDKTFLTDASIDVTATEAVQKGILSKEEATREQAILLYFDKRLTPLLREMAKQRVDDFFRRLEDGRPQLDSFVRKLYMFTKTSGMVTVPVFLVVNPENGYGGGEANGGRLVIECQPVPDPLSFVVHESLHFLLRPYQDKIKTLSDAAGVDAEIVNEGLAYAMEGLTEDPDLLPNALIERIVSGLPRTDTYNRFYMAALQIRPLLRKALAKGETIDVFLPTAIDRVKFVTHP